MPTNSLSPRGDDGTAKAELLGVDQEKSKARTEARASDLLPRLLHHAKLSDCSKLKFGAAALDESGRILSLGVNHNPHAERGWSCAKDCVGGIRRGVRSGTCVERCYAVHAEQDALIGVGQPVYEIAVAGLLPDGSLFDNGGGFYCTVCARIMASAKVQFVSIWTGGQRKRLTMREAWEQSYRVATA